MHILSLKTGAPHPDAQIPRVRIPEFQSIGQDLQIVGDVALVTCVEDGDQNSRVIILHIVNWRLGLVTHVSFYYISNFT